MSKDITIAEGSEAKQFFGVKKLETNLLAGGTCFWVPEDEIVDFYNIGGSSVNDYFESNLFPYVCTPNLTLVDGVPTWYGAGHLFSCENHDEIRGYVVVGNMGTYLKEDHLISANDYTQMTTSEVQELKVNGKQLYFVEILGGKSPYTAYTFTSATDRISDISQDVAEMYKVYTRKVENTYEKGSIKLTGDSEATTYDIDITLGTGTVQGANTGKAFIKKKTDGLYTSYVSKTDDVERTICIDDTGYYAMTNDKKIPLLVGQPVQTLPTTFEEGEVYLLYSAGV